MKVAVLWPTSMVEIGGRTAAWYRDFFA